MQRILMIMAALAPALLAAPPPADSAAETADSSLSIIPAKGDMAGNASEAADSSLSIIPVKGDMADSAAETADSPLSIIPVKGDMADSALARVKHKRAAAYGPAAADSAASFDPYRADAADIFRGDAASGAEALRYRSASSVSIPFSLSSSLNRLLPYGNPAPVGGLSSPTLAAPPSPAYAPRYYGGDVSGAQASEFTMGAGGGAAWLPYPGALAAPELNIYWENGVFGQNTLGLRLSRPLSQNLMLSLFSNYRYFEGTRFDHEGNDIAAFYEIFRSDTSTIMNRGYNPLTDEHALGAALEWLGADSSKIFAAFSYAGLQNEYALNDSPQIAASVDPDAQTPSLDRLRWALSGRQSYRIDAALLNKKVWVLEANVKTAFVTEDIASLYEPDTTVANWSGGTSGFFGSADVTLPFGLGAALSGIVKGMEFFNGAKEVYSQGNPELFYKRNFDFGFVNTDMELRAGAALFPWDDTIYATPTAKAAAALSPNDNAKLNIYAALDGITVYPDYDTSIYKNLHRPWIDRYTKLGAEGTLTLGYFGALLGYQLTTGIDAFTVKASWPQGIPPYAQPNHTIIISPWMSRLGGFSLLSRTFVTDTKPHIKTSAALSHIFRPRGMSHNFETELGFDYWSERDPVTFAGHTGWNEPILDLNLKITAHIRTFRLFYKVDNVLNTRHAYVPGYFSPGLTFRWGINWFLS